MKQMPVVGTVPKSNRKIVEKSKIDTPCTQIQYHLLSWLDTGTSVTSGGVKLVLFKQFNNIIVTTVTFHGQ
jgi:hypothetical protein